MRPEIYNVSQPHLVQQIAQCDCDYDSDYDYDYNELSHISTNYELITQTDLRNTNTIWHS